MRSVRFLTCDIQNKFRNPWTAPFGPSAVLHVCPEAAPDRLGFRLPEGTGAGVASRGEMGEGERGHVPGGMAKEDAVCLLDTPLHFLIYL